ncbi:MAG: FG-GAP-like repeat-containing protein [Halofilum sp. (in: g-proteobacteria)]|nr:FG-GAP-like repeat-containing protein [Halofilum sp. (in: g-proteobacteria)]
MSRAVIVAACLALAGCWSAPEPDSEAVRGNNRGVALMGQYEYDRAREAFSDLLERHPGWTPVRLNLAVALLNRQLEGDEERALTIARDVLETDPENLRARYIIGLLALHRGNAERARTHLRAVSEADPGDAHAAYFLGRSLRQLGDTEAAAAAFARARERNPYLRSAHYGFARAAGALGRDDDAAAALETYRSLGANPRAEIAEFRYTRMGRKAEAVVVDADAGDPGPPPEGSLFAAAQRLPVAGQGARELFGGQRPHPVAPAAADINGDGRLDLFLAGMPGTAEDANAVLVGSDDGFRPVPDHPLASVDRVLASAWGDIDNDGRIDVYLCREGANRLWMQTADGGWRDATGTTGTGGGDRRTVDCLMLDADHDGDLDLFAANADGPDQLLNNDLDGGFRPIAGDAGIAGGSRASRAVALSDLDGDRDTDLVVLAEQPPHAVYRNDRMWRYQAADGFDRFREQPALAVVAGDADADGQPELYTLAPDGEVRRWAPDSEGSWKSRRVLDAWPGEVATETARLALLDVTGDGRPELLRSEPAGWAAWPTRGEADEALFRAEAGGRSAWLPIQRDAGRGPSVVGIGASGDPRIWSPGPGRHGFVTLRLSGRSSEAESMRSNASALGTHVAARSGSRWTLLEYYRRHSGPGHGLQPLAIGLGDAQALDFVELRWPDGVLQTETALARGQEHRIAEVQRQLASCPVVFAWNGEAYEFVSDILGVGGIGFLLAPGEYSEPRPRESLLLPEELLVPRNGRYVIKIGEPMEEVAYLDSARLDVYDLPPGWDVFVDERMQVGGPPPTGEARFFRTERLPVAAGNDRGDDVTAAVRSADLRAAPVGPIDRRFIGRLAREHVLTLEFDAPLTGPAGKPWLLVDGWVEYPYSQTLFAAWQADAGYEAPTLEARGRDGRWHTVLERFGYPAGMPRRSAVPLDGLPEGTRELRLRTNQEIYFDRVAVVYAQEPPSLERTRVAPEVAQVRRVGFARRTTGEQRQPRYDYGNRQPFWDTRHAAGHYTEFGPATALLAEDDDAVAIIGPGEEVHFEFPAVAGSVNPGTRRFVLRAHGWAKDMDLYTRDGETVAPLPGGNGSNDARAMLHQRYNTRFESGR